MLCRIGYSACVIGIALFAAINLCGTQFNKEATVMAIDITNPAAFSSLKLEDLIADAAERKDRAAYNWLMIESEKEVERELKNGKKIMVAKPLTTIRKEYLRDYLGYKPATSEEAKARAKAAAKAKRKAEHEELFKRYQF